MKSAEDLLAEIFKRSRLPKDNTIVLFEQSPKSPGDLNWLASAQGVFYPETLSRYNAAVAELLQEHPLVNWEGATRLRPLRRIAFYSSDEPLLSIPTAAHPSEKSLDQAFDAVAAAMVIAAFERQVGVAEAAAERLGLVKLGDRTPSQDTDWERIDQGRTLRLRWHIHDQPPMHIMRLELRSSDELLRSAEQQYEN